VEETVEKNFRGAGARIDVHLTMLINVSVTKAGRCSSMAPDDVFAPGDALHKLEILCVDDDSQRGDALRKLLLNLGAARVQVVESAKEAIRAALGTPCHIVIAEYRLTPTDGIQFVRDIRAVGNYPRALMPVLIVSDPVKSEVIEAAFEAGANHFMIRPLHASKLYERIVWALADSRPFVVKDGRYVIKLVRPKAPAAMAAPAAATK
jgi:DNA-binding response OmpR family regulator